jgi:hypothetical protein
MTNSVAKILAAVIAALAAIISVLASVFVARFTVNGKINELRQAQIGDILKKRIEIYPSLWSLCQKSITHPMFSACPAPVEDGWAATLSEQLEDWHAENGCSSLRAATLPFTACAKRRG